MLELVVGAVLIGIFVSGTIPMIRWVQTASRIDEQHATATQEVANLMERLSALPASERTTEYLESLTVSDSAQAALPDAELVVAADGSDDGLQKLTLSLSWGGSSPAETYSTKLTAWLPSEEGGQ